MKKLKKLSFLLVLIILTVMTTGCLQYEVNLELNKDNTGKLMISSAADRDMKAAFEAEGETEEEIPLIDSIPEGYDVKRTDLKYKDKDQNYEGEKIEVNFNNATEFIKKLNQDKDQNLRIINLDNGNKRVEFDMGSVGGQDPFFFYDALSDLNGKIKLTIKTDYNVVNHNASSVNNGVYTWDILDEMLNSSEPRMKSFFLEYTGEDKIILPPSTGKTRKEVEKTLGLKLSDKNFHGKALQKLGLLEGTEKGLELERGLTRTEGATMYARLLGIEREIETFVKYNPNYNSGFTDVPAWAKSTIDYLHAKNLVNGISPTKYGSNNMMTINDYSTLVLRALGYSEDSGEFQWSKAGIQSEKLGLYAEDELTLREILGNQGFTRASMSYVSYNALFFKNKTTNDRLIDRLRK